MIRFLAQLLLVLFVFRVIYATARFLLGSRRSSRPIAPPPPQPFVPPAAPRSVTAIDRENAIDVPFTEIPGPRP